MIKRFSRHLLLLSIVLTLVGLTACQHGYQSAQKVDGLPADSTDTKPMPNDDLPTFQDSTTAPGADTVQAVKPAVIYGSAVDVEELTMEVLSNGCTQASDFELHYADTAKDELTVTVLRVKPDGCRKMPAVVSVTLPMDGEKVAGKSVLLANEPVERPSFKRQ